MSSITIQNMNKSFNDKKVIDNLNIYIDNGELIALLGPSGCGKTTTLKIIAGLIEMDQGDILFDDKSVKDIPTEKRGALLVFQDYLLFPHMDINANIAFGLKMRGVKKKVRQKRAAEMLSLVNLDSYGQLYPSELSGGQKQRIALARALAVNPEVLLLDEPLSNLDSNLREEMRELIKEIHVKEGMTTIFVTHDKEEAIMVADKIAIMNKGKIEQFGTPEELYNNPVNKYVADFFGLANYIKFEGHKGQLLPAVSKIFNDRDNIDKLTIMIRPEDIEIKEQKEDKLVNKVQIAGKVSKKIFAGEHIYYQVETAEGVFKVTTLARVSIKPGRTVYLIINKDNICFLR